MFKREDIAQATIEGVWYTKGAVVEVLSVADTTMNVRVLNGAKKNAPITQVVSKANFQLIPKETFKP